MQVKITPNEKGTPPANWLKPNCISRWRDGRIEARRLRGLGTAQRRRRNVTFPAVNIR